MTQEASLLDQILSGRSRQLQMLAASGVVPLPPEQLIPIQVALTGSPDPEVAQAATEGIAGQEPHLVSSFLEQHAGATELLYFGTRSREPKILEAILRRRDVPREVLMEMAPLLGPEMQEVLILRQDAILEKPELLVALERNPGLSNYTKRRIWEYREHLLPREKVPPKKAEEILAEAESVTEEEIAEAIAEARERRPDDDKKDELTGLSDGQIRSLPVPIRIKLARGANRQLRSILVRDNNSQVALMVLRGNPLNDQEVEAIANSRAVLDEVLEEIARHREWIRKYNIVKALVRNPRTKPPVALRFMSRLTMRDLRDLARDKGVSSVVRSTAVRLYQSKR